MVVEEAVVVGSGGTPLISCAIDSGITAPGKSLAQSPLKSRWMVGLWNPGCPVCSGFPLEFCCLFHAGVEDRHAMEFHWVVVMVASWSVCLLKVPESSLR